MSEQIGFFPEVHRYATFSSCRTWRYSLRRIWNPDAPLVMFVGLNPSTADERVDDPTITRCLNFARDWRPHGRGFGGLVMTNLFAFRATDPKEMKAAIDPIGPDNDRALIKWAARAGVVVAAWGIHGEHLNRADQVVRLLGNFGVLGLTKHGHPKHPLYLPKTSVPLDPLSLLALDGYRSEVPA